MKMLWPLALMVVIFFLSSIPGNARIGQSWLLTDLQPSVQNFLHIPLYGLLQWLWMRAFQKPERSGAAVIGLAALIVGVYGIFDEIHQAFVPGRYASAQDVLLNIVGMFCAALIYFFLSRPFGGLRTHR